MKRFLLISMIITWMVSCANPRDKLLSGEYRKIWKLNKTSNSNVPTPTNGIVLDESTETEILTFNAVHTYTKLIETCSIESTSADGTVSIFDCNRKDTSLFETGKWRISYNKLRLSVSSQLKRIESKLVDKKEIKKYSFEIEELGHSILVLKEKEKTRIYYAH